jgi:tetratricopeptide (TPR) repeat protein
MMLSCSTQKNTFVNRNYHNLTAHYNVFFNGNEAIKAGLYNIDTQIEEDYTKILPIHKESLPGTENIVSSDMDIAIEKGTKLIKLHSITKPPKSDRKKSTRKRKPLKAEYIKWIDDAYIMMGRAYLYQKDYIRAASTFTLIIRKYKDEPIKYTAYLWLIRTYNESERYTQSRELVESLEGNNLFPKELEGELAIVSADLHLKQQHYEEAIQYLNIAIKKIKGNKRKTRYAYILAQLYQESGNDAKALEAYHQVIRRRPDYTMLFNARINSASVYSGEGNVSVLRKELNKMSKKKRNEPFLDQIYFALGNILYNEGKIDDALSYYRKSVAISSENTYQSALSSLTLADIYFDQRKYIPSSNYYDSAMAVISESYPNYKAIAEKHSSLSLLVTQLITIETQDSLQALANLSKEELDAKINNWITIEKKKQEALEAAEAAGDYSTSTYRSSSSSSSSSGWYFYNSSTISYGKKEFSRLWGSRENEDNWRRNDKSIIIIEELSDSTTEDLASAIETEKEIRDTDPSTREYYLQDIPSNDSLMMVSNEKIKNALFYSGTIFKTDFNDFERSIESFISLNSRYPENNYTLSSYFYLWDLYTTIQIPDSANYYKDLIISNYPDSNYAKYLINPNYFIEAEALKDSINSMYSLAFNAYQKRDFKKAERYSQLVLNMNPDTTLIPKARFIQMISRTREKSKNQFADSLQSYIDKYPSAEPTPLATQILELTKEDKLNDYSTLVNTGYLNEVIKNLELLPQNEDTENPFAGKWDSDNNLLHYFVIAFPNDEKIDINRLKFDIANYNIDNYTMLDFDIETEKLNNETKLIIVRNFDQKESAMIYFLSIIRKPQVFKTLAGTKFLNFIISNNNFREMLSDRSYNQYIQFFVKNYSSFTSGEFPDEELESPEELMARLKTKDDEFIEQGEFVLIDTEKDNGLAPEPKEQIFTLDYSSPHSFLIMVKEPRFRTGYLMRDFVRYNSSNHRDKRLRVIPNNLKESTLLMVSTFDNAYEANEYLKTVNEDKTLFKSLDETEFETYIISNENLNKLKETNNLTEWDQFYKTNFVYRKPTKPTQAIEGQQEKEIVEPVKKVEEKTIPSIEETYSTTEKAAAIIQVVKDTANKEQTDTSESTTTPTASVEIDKTEDKEQTTEKATATKDTISESTTALSYDGPYLYNPESDHNLVYLLPSSGSNKVLLSTYLGRFNTMKYRSFALKVSIEAFNDFQSLVIISGIGNRDKATDYLNEVKKDSRINMSLRNVNYKSFLFSNDNLIEFKQSKDINEYQKFYQLYY